MTPQLRGLLIVLGLAFLAGLVYLGVTKLLPVFSRQAPAAEQTEIAQLREQNQELEQQNRQLQEQMAQLRELTSQLQAAVQAADGQERQKLLEAIAQLQTRLGQLELRLEAVLKQKQPAETATMPAQPTEPPGTTAPAKATAKPPASTEMDWEQVAETAVKLGIGLAAACLLLVPDCPLQVASWGRRPPESPTPVTGRPQPPVFRQDAFCQSRQASLPVSNQLVDFRYQLTSNKLVVVADPEWGRGFVQCLALTLSPAAQERFHRIWPGKSTPEVLFVRCFQYWNRSECVLPTEALEVYDEGWVFGFAAEAGQLHVLWGIQRIPLSSGSADP